MIQDISSSNTMLLDKDVKAIKNSLQNILLTPVGSFPGRPDFGSNLNGILFEDLGPAIKIIIHYDIIETLERWEPRIIVDDILFDDTNTDTNNLILNIKFRIKNDALNQDHSIIVKT